MTKFKKNTHLSLPLNLSICRCTLIFPKGCACTSIYLFLYLHLQKRFGSRSDPNGIQERMFRQFKKNAHAIESTQSVVQKPMRMIKWVFSISQLGYTLSCAYETLSTFISQRKGKIQTSTTNLVFHACSTPFHARVH